MIFKPRLVKRTMFRPKSAVSEKTSVLEKKMLTFFSLIVDVLTFLLIVALLFMIVRQIILLFGGPIWALEIKDKIDTMLFALILVELFTILFFYLKEHKIKVDRIIEVGIISLIRDVIFKVYETEVARLFAMAAILVVLGALFFIEKYFAKSRECAEIVNGKNE